ncbi:hypothetical protein GCM10027074_13250 [Streptomyces deserti]
MRARPAGPRGLTDPLLEELRAGRHDLVIAIGVPRVRALGSVPPRTAAHPQVRLDLRTGDAAAALARLDEGEVDVAGAGIPARLPEPLVSRTVTVTDWSWSRPGTARTTALPFPSSPHRGLVRDAADRWLRARGTVPDVVCEPDGHEGLLTLVALGCGTGVVPRLVRSTARCGTGWRCCPPSRRRSRSRSGCAYGVPICGGRWWRRCGA